MPQLHNSMDFMRLLYSFNLVSFLILSLRIQIAFSFEIAVVESGFLLSMSLSSPIKDPTFFTVHQFSSDLFVCLSIHLYSFLSVFTLRWCGRSFSLIFSTSL